MYIKQCVSLSTEIFFLAIEIPYNADSLKSYRSFLIFCSEKNWQIFATVLYGILLNIG